jgi:SH3 domain protein
MRIQTKKMTLKTRLWATCLLVLASLATAGAETVWVSDQFEVMLRTGPSTSNAIERMLPSGTALEVLERDDEGGYARVRTVGGTEGWVLTRYLMNEASAREQLSALTNRLTNANAAGTTLSSQLDAVKGEHDAAVRQISALENDKQRLEQELAEIKRTAANVLSISDQNKNLREQLANAEIQAATLEQQNRELTSQTTRYWFISGALVLVAGMVLGIWLPRIRWQRRTRYDRF